jgi:hypothetical protein
MYLFSIERVTRNEFKIVSKKNYNFSKIIFSSEMIDFIFYGK